MTKFSWAWGGVLACWLIGSAWAGDDFCRGFQQVRGCVEWHGDGAPPQPWYTPHNPKDRPDIATPEPSTWAMLAFAGAVSLAWARRR